jgi:uncharacterized membrane protein
VSKSVAPNKDRLRCAITGQDFLRRDLVHLENVLPSLADRIRKDYPELGPDDPVARSEVARYRSLYVQELLSAESGDLSEIERRVTDSLATHDTLAQNVEQKYEDARTLSERISDDLANVGGSWMFISGFAAALAVWIALNLLLGNHGAFDPYPFILLNLVLSCLAAVQAPIIMMSQRRQEAKDRLRSLNDYQVNLKAELEIRHLHDKIDHLLGKQWQRLAEIQQLQLEIMQDRRQ